MQMHQPHSHQQALELFEQSPDMPPNGYRMMLAIVNLVTEAPSGQAAVEAVYQLLERHGGLLALTLELTSGPVTHLYPYGDAAEIVALEDGNIADRHRVVHLCSVQNTSVLQGKITYIFAADTLMPLELLEAATAQISLRLMLETFAERAAQAEDRARQRISELATLNEIGQAIEPGELPRLMQMITDRTALLMDAQACSLMLVDEELGRLRLAASHGLAADVPEYVQRIGEGIAGRVAATGQPMLIKDAEADPRLQGLTLKPDIGSSMLVPMKNQDGHVLGVLAIRRRRPAMDFTTEDLKLFSVFATQAALAVTNMRLYADLRSRMSELLKLTTLSRTLISTINLDELLASVVDEVRNIVNFERCCLYMRDGGRPIFMPRVWRGYSATIGRNPVREGEGAVGLTARSKMIQTFDASDTVLPGQDKERTYLQLKGYARSLGTDAFVAVPILDSHQRCVGVLVADNKGRHEPISREQKSLLEAFVNQAGIAIDNSLLYAQMQDTLANIRRLKDYTDSVLNSIGAAIISTDVRGVITRWNPAAQQTLRLPASAFRETQLTDLFIGLRLPTEEQDQLLEMIRRVQETGESVQRFRLTLHPEDRPSITLFLMVSRLPEHHMERAGVVLIFEDVTQEVQLEAELNKMRRLADIGQLAAKMAHEVRNALSPIRAAAQIIQGDLSAQNISTEWTDIIVAEVDGLTRLTREMLDFARPTSLDPRALNLNDFVVSSVQTLASFLAEHQVQVEWVCMPTLPDLMGDPVQLGQVVRNIVMNAAQSMSGGGVLRICTCHDPVTNLFVLEFHDQGEGIAENDLERIFRPFVTTRTKGTGLGLPIVQKIVDHHGGRVEVESYLGRGTCFRVLLPPQPPQDSGERLPDAAPLISRKTAGNFPDK
jgi:PAS domain S-box-containing protein